MKALSFQLFITLFFLLGLSSAHTQVPVHNIDKATSPIDGIELAVQLCDNGIEISWVVDGENDITLYELHRAGADKDFVPVAWIEANSKDMYHEHYSYVDYPHVEGIVYYRLALHDYNGFCEYTDATYIILTPPMVPVLAVIPNPMIGNEMMVSLSGVPSAVTGILQVVDPSDKIVFQEEVTFCEGDLYHVLLEERVNGPYIVQYLCGDIAVSVVVMVIDGGAGGPGG